MSDFSDNAVGRLALIQKRIDMAHRASPLPSPTPQLIAVSKTHPAEAILPLLEAGHRHFGENRVQEAQEKWPALKTRFPDLVLHLIGPLQSNKVKEALALFDVLHTVDRPKLMQALAEEMAKSSKALPCLVQVNTGEEPQKAGVAPQEADAFIEDCRKQLTVTGLMCIPPAGANPAPHFGLLRKIAERHGLKELSMGMSDDFEMAVGLGATYIRVGTAIFGARS